MHTFILCPCASATKMLINSAECSVSGQLVELPLTLEPNDNVTDSVTT